jgi:hypothetical protein
MITLNREEAQQVLDAIAAAKGYIYHNVLDDKENQYDKAINTLRARLALHDMNQAAEQNGEEL